MLTVGLSGAKCSNQFYSINTSTTIKIKNLHNRKETLYACMYVCMYRENKWKQQTLTNKTRKNLVSTDDYVNNLDNIFN